MSCGSTGSNEGKNNGASTTAQKADGVPNTFAPIFPKDTILSSETMVDTTDREKCRPVLRPVSDFQERLKIGTHREFKGKNTLKDLISNSTNAIKLKYNRLHNKDLNVHKFTGIEFKPLKKIEMTKKCFIPGSKESLESKFDLPLPIKFDHLCKLCSALDQSINYFKVKNKLLVFDDLKASIESSFRM